MTKDPTSHILLTGEEGAPLSVYQRRRFAAVIQLRSTDADLLYVPRTRTSYCDRSFAVCGPTVWNSLPTSLRSTDSFAAFCRPLKTFLFDSVAA